MLRPEDNEILCRVGPGTPIEATKFGAFSMLLAYPSRSAGSRSARLPHQPAATPLPSSLAEELALADAKVASIAARVAALRRGSELALALAAAAARCRCARRARGCLSQSST